MNQAWTSPSGFQSVKGESRAPPLDSEAEETAESPVGVGGGGCCSWGVRGARHPGVPVCPAPVRACGGATCPHASPPRPHSDRMS